MINDNSEKINNFDPLLQKIADYTLTNIDEDDSTLKEASYCLVDSLGCALEALEHKACTKILGPMFSETKTTQGSRIPGTNFILDPISAAFNIGTMIRWLDFNDTWLASEWGHPSDNLGGILSVADYLSQKRSKDNQLKMIEVLKCIVKAHEIQGVIALKNSFNKVGLDHVILVKLASTAVCGKLLGLTKLEILNALSQVFLDGNSLRTYRHFPNTGSRKSWAAGDATARGVFLAMMSKKGEMGYPKVLSTKIWGFNDCLFNKKKLKIEQKFGSYVINNILFKISYPAEFHAQTAVEAAIILHPKIINNLENIKKITIRTHESAIRIIDKKGTLNNPADRDHCIQYMVTIGLIFGRLVATDYEDNIASDPRVDKLRKKIFCIEDKSFTLDYLDPNKRSIANGITIEFHQGKNLEEVVVEYPIGHKRRREEGIPLLIEKFNRNLNRCYNNKEVNKIMDVSLDLEKLIDMPVHDYLSLYSKK